MGRASRQKKERRQRRIELGLNRLELPGRARRVFEREVLGNVELLSEIREELAEFSPLSVALSLSQLGLDVPNFARARLFREVIQAKPHGTSRMTTNQAAAFARRVLNAWDPMVVDSVGDGTMHETVFGRLLSEQLPVQKQREVSVHRTLQVLYDPESGGPLGPAAWRARLGLDLPAFILGVHTLASRLGGGQLSLTRYLTEMPPDFERITLATVDLLASSCDDLVNQTPRGGYGQYDILPLGERPIVRVDNDHLCAPAPEYVGLAASPAALYIRLVREDKGTRDRSSLVGSRYEDFLYNYCDAALQSGWNLIRLDGEPHPGTRIADIAFFPDDCSFLVLIETKMKLPGKAAETGDTKARSDIEDYYQEAFEQLESTTKSLGRKGFLATAPVDVPTFGILATFDQHPVTVADGRTLFGLRLPNQGPSSVGAFVARLPCAVLSADDTEVLVDFFGVATPAECLSVLRETFKARSPSHAMRHAVNDLDGAKRDPNPVALAGLNLLAGAFEQPELRSLVEESIQFGYRG